MGRVSVEEHADRSMDLQADPTELKEIFNQSLVSLRGATLDITRFATTERFRFIDCSAWITDNVLKIYETSTLPNLYSTISYVWFGLVSESSALDVDGWFRVYCGKREDGTMREDGGPINMRMLYYACQWSSRASCSYLWLDRICILQTSKIDKTWQIRKMYDVYANCQECIVLPGGLQRLASVYDETSWAERAWTYQEAIVCWDYAVVFTKDWHRPPGEQHWLIPGECHWQYLLELFVTGSTLLGSQGPVSPGHTGSEGADTDYGTESGSHQRPVLIFGRNNEALKTLERIIQYRSWNELCEPGETRINDHVILQLLFQGVQMRTSSRPVDMVFSVLGLVDVQNEIPLQRFEENHRFRATLALVETMLRTEGLDDDNEDEDDEQEMDGEQEGHNTLLDVPLWAKIEYIGADQHQKLPYLPTLQELALLLDDNASLDSVSNSVQTISPRCLPLSKWEYNVELTRDDPEEYASAIASQIPGSVLMEAYHGGDTIQERILFEHEMEGVIELRRTLDIGRSEDDLLNSDLLADLFVYGWTLKLEGHPYMRFYKFDVSHLIL
ncbi:hypothetical protein M422DRAFT_66300 [Sphaerobolus stellatus SS14]|nr:hypothetical protein M422DRAFT_66300 [Sphaerobolus stellatus SS14]